MKECILIILRGIGQVMFQNNALSGALMLAGIAVGSPSAAVLAIAGNAVSTLTARLCRYPASEIRDGLYGFNGTLAGIAIGVFFSPGWAAAALLVAGAALSTLLARLFILWRIPGYTAPFVVATWVAIAVTHWMPELKAPAAAVPAWVDAQWIRALSLHFGQVMFEGGNLATGALFLAGIAANDRRAAAYAIMGAILPMATVLFTGDYAAFDSGLYGYNGVLCAVALAGPARTDLLKAVTAVALSTALQLVGLRYGLPTLTAPFVAATWTVVALSAYCGRRHRRAH